ncbi:MAG: aspartate/glutamate racemase family protein [Candidatus Bathyarchaeota archaeon]
MPSSNITMEPEFYRMAPQGVSIHSARMRLTEFTHDALMKMMGDVQREAELLSSAHVDVIVYGCSTCSLVGGVDWEQILMDQIHFNTGAKVVTVNQAVVEAIRALGCGVVGVVTPYSNALNRLEKRYLEAHGLKVSSINGLGLYDAYKIANAKDETILELGEQAARDAQVLLFSCTSLPVVHLIERMESQWGLPVVTSNQAGLWASLNGAGLEAPKGYGRLFES